MIPVVIIDTTSRPDIDATVLAHLDFGGGDVCSMWPVCHSCFGAQYVRLVLRMSGPSDCLIILKFDLERYGMTVDQIFHSQGVWIQPGRPGDRVRATLENPRLLVEVPTNREFGHNWEAMFRKSIVKRFRKNGMGRSAAKRAATEFIPKWREMFHRRIPFDIRDAYGQSSRDNLPDKD